MKRATTYMLASVIGLAAVAGGYFGMAALEPKHVSTVQTVLQPAPAWSDPIDDAAKRRCAEGGQQWAGSWAWQNGEKVPVCIG